MMGNYRSPRPTVPQMLDELIAAGRTERAGSGSGSLWARQHWRSDATFWRLALPMRGWNGPMAGSLGQWPGS
jgi:hypothetical protein